MTPEDYARDMADEYQRRQYREIPPGSVFDRPPDVPHVSGGILTRDEHAAVEWGAASGRRMVLAALERYHDGGTIETGHGESVPLDPAPVAEQCENASQSAQDRFYGASEAFAIVTTSLGFAALLPLLAASAAIGWIVARLGHLEATR